MIWKITFKVKIYFFCEINMKFFLWSLGILKVKIFYLLIFFYDLCECPKTTSWFHSQLSSRNSSSNSKKVNFLWLITCPFCNDNNCFPEKMFSTFSKFFNVCNTFDFVYNYSNDALESLILLVLNITVYS